MIILDTNVISELMREVPNQKVTKWMTTKKPLYLGLSTITIAEIQRGLARLPMGKRRSRLTASFTSFVTEAFSGRIFSFDEDAAWIYGEIAAKRESEGFNTDAVDLMIAAISKSNNAAIATRNTKDFEGCGLEIINPWK